MIHLLRTNSKWGHSAALEELVVPTQSFVMKISKVGWPRRLKDTASTAAPYALTRGMHKTNTKHPNFSSSVTSPKA